MYTHSKYNFAHFVTSSVKSGNKSTCCAILLLFVLDPSYRIRIYIHSESYYNTEPIVYGIEALPFWIPPGRSITWEMGGSQFTKTLCTGLSQTTKNENGDCPYSRFPGFVTIPCMGSWWTGTPPPLQGGRLGPTMTDITERGLKCLALQDIQKTYI